MPKEKRRSGHRLKSYPGNHPYPQRTMNRLPKSDDDLEPRIAANLLEVLIRTGLILILAIRCTKGSPGGWEAGRESPQRCC